MENNQNQQQPIKPNNPTPWIIIIILIILGIGAYFLFFQEKGINTNNANATTNTNTVVNLNTNTNTNTNIDTSDWKTYTNTQYNFSIQYPNDFIYWETKLSTDLANQRVDGLLFDAGFRPQDLQGSVLAIRVFSKSLEKITESTQEHGNLTNKTISINNQTAIVMTDNIRRYGIQTNEYTYIIETNNYRNENDLEIFDTMFQTFKINK